MVSIKPELESEYTETPEVTVILSPVRDQAYLKSLINPTSTSPDAGVGGVDNVFFFEPGHYPGGINSTNSPTREVYLVWIGTPAGTNPYNNPQYNIYYARAHLDRYRPDAPASEWLEPPVLLISWDQISRDIINWFDTVMSNAGIGTSSAGVSNPISLSSVSYITGYGGIIWSGAPSTITINVTGTVTLHQCHFVYDPIDDTILMYLSVMFPNWNPATKTQYVYKFPRSLLTNNQSINQYAVNGLTPTTTQTPPPNNQPYFLGGLVFDSIVENVIANAVNWAWSNTSQFEATPLFTINYDFYELGNYYGYSLKNGYLPAIYVSNALGYMENYGAPGDLTLFGIVLADIHKNPANPQTFYNLISTSNGTTYPGLNPSNCSSCYSIPIVGLIGRISTFGSDLSVYRFGPILPGKNFGLQGVYLIPIASASRSIIQGSPSNQLKLLLVSPIFNQIEGYGGLAFAWTKENIDLFLPPSIGIHTPYLTVLPDGELKLITVARYPDGFTEGISINIDRGVLSIRGKTLITAPSLIMGQSSAGGSYYLVTSNPNAVYSSAFSGVVTYTFGKKYAKIFANINAGSFVPIRIYSRPRTRSAPDLQQMYGNTPSSSNGFMWSPTLPANIPSGGFGYIIYLTDDSVNMPYSEAHPSSKKIRLKGEVLWAIQGGQYGQGGFGPILIELYDD